jgi:hypothetical protein
LHHLTGGEENAEKQKVSGGRKDIRTGDIIIIIIITTTTTTTTTTTKSWRKGWVGDVEHKTARVEMPTKFW